MLDEIFDKIRVFRFEWVFLLSSHRLFALRIPSNRICLHKFCIWWEWFHVWIDISRTMNSRLYCYNINSIRWSVEYPIILIFGSIPTDYCLDKYLEVWTIWIHWIFKLKRCSKFTFNRKFIANYANGTYGDYRRLHNKRPPI